MTNEDSTPSDASGEEWLTTAEVAAEFGFNTETIRRWIRDGRLPARQPGLRAFKVSRADVMRLLEERTTSSGSPSGVAPNPGLSGEDDDAPQMIGNSIKLADK